jgi:hypothetical protein
MTDLSTSGRQRQANKDFLLRRASLEVVGPVRRKLGAWQSRAVHLVAIGRRLRAHGQPGPSYLAEVEAMSAALEFERSRLAERLRDTPRDVAAHGELRDTERALESFGAVLAEARALLGDRQERGSA